MKVFISYVSENRETVDRLRSALEAKGVRCWVDKYDIDPGAFWKDAIRDAISHGAFFIACFSKEYNDRKRTYMNEELLLAIEQLRQRHPNQVWFIPILLSGEIPDLDIGSGRTLRDLQWIDLHPETWEEGIWRLLRTVQPPDRITSVRRTAGELTHATADGAETAHPDSLSAVASQRHLVAGQGEPVPTTIALAPTADYAIAGLETQWIVATVTDQFGNVVPGVEVRFVTVEESGLLTNAVGAGSTSIVTDMAGQAKAEWCQQLGDWGVEKVMAVVGGSCDWLPNTRCPTSEVSWLVWAYVNGSGSFHNLVSVKPGTQQVMIHAGHTPWNERNVRVSLRPYDTASELGGAVYSDAVDNFIRTRHHTWAKGDAFFVVADGRTPGLVYDRV